MSSVFRIKRRDGKKDKVWRFKYKDYAGRWRYGIGWPDKAKTVNHAQEIEADHRSIRKGEKPMPSASANGLLRPIKDIVADYLSWGKAQGGRNGRPWDGQHCALKKKSVDWWVEKLRLDVLADIQLEPVEKAVHELIEAGELAPKSVALRVEALRSLCLWAVRRGLLPTNPLVSLTKISIQPREPHRALSDPEVKSLLESAPALHRLWYEVALQTGYRVSELRALRVRDLDIEGPSLRLGAEFTKNRKEASQPIARDLAKRLQEMADGRAGDARLLNIPSSSASQIFREESEAAGIVGETNEGKATWHSLRKSYVNALIHSGADVKTVMELARHSTASLTMEVYASADQGRLREAAEAAARHIEDTLASQPCCARVAQKEIGKSVKVTNLRASMSCGGRGMVGGTGFEPVTPCV